jgi:adenylate cyclase class IV
VPANIEIKARARDFARQKRLAEELAGGPATPIDQEDVFFPAAAGRLKLRILGPRQGELIHYRRPDTAGPKRSRYRIAPTSEPLLLREALAAALGTVGCVRKRRWLCLVGQTRIHLDEVDGLGQFLELEVVLESPREEAADRTGTAIGEEEEAAALASRLMEALEVRPEDLVSGAYLDLLLDGSGDASSSPIASR